MYLVVLLESWQIVDYQAIYAPELEFFHCNYGWKTAQIA